MEQESQKIILELQAKVETLELLCTKLQAERNALLKAIEVMAAAKSNG